MRPRRRDRTVSRGRSIHSTYSATGLRFLYASG
jgi:hypothetical protein